MLFIFQRVDATQTRGLIARYAGRPPLCDINEAKLQYIFYFHEESAAENVKFVTNSAGVPIKLYVSLSKLKSSRSE